MLKAHIDAIEDTLLATSRIPANSGHSLHKGTPREAFIRQFLESHLSERIAIGSGEIIDAQSVPNPPPTAQRNQFDIVIYRRDYPKLDFGGGVSAFLAESVVATIEVKSTLTMDELESSVLAAQNAKALKRHIVKAFTAGHQPPAILNYVVAYDGPVKMNTVYNWIAPVYKALSITAPSLPPNGSQRTSIPSATVDGIFVLGKGFVVFDNVPFGFVTDAMRQADPSVAWTVGQEDHGSLLLMFILLTVGASGLSGAWLDPLPYLSGFKMPAGSIGFGS